MSWLNSVFGSNAGQLGQGIATNPAQLQNTYAQIGNQQAYAAQQHQISQLGRYNQALMPQWMINGRVMSIEEFGQELFGDDTPELTMFLLKYKDIEGKK